jgi:hypothetical protein
MVDAASADTYLESAAAASILIVGSDPAWYPALVGRILALQAPEGYFEDPIGGSMQGRDRDELRVSDTYRAVMVLASETAPSAQARAALTRATTWLAARWPGLSYSPYLAWEAAAALDASGLPRPIAELQRFAKSAVVTTAAAGIDSLQALLDAFGAASLARSSIGPTWGSPAQGVLLSAFAAKLATVSDALDVYATVSGYIAAGGDPHGSAVGPVVEELIGRQSAEGLFGDPIGGVPSLQATWYALATLQLAGAQVRDPAAIAALDAALSSLSGDNPAEIRGWLEASRIAGRMLSSAETARLVQFATTSLPSHVDETNIFDWYEAVTVLETLDAPVPTPSIASWPITDRAGLLAAIVLAQTRTGQAALDTNGLKTQVRTLLGADLSMPELYFYVRTLGPGSMSSAEKARVLARLEILRIPNESTYAGLPGGSADLRATYFGMWLANVLGSKP